MSINFSKQYYTDLTSISQADPAILTLADHELYEGDKINLETTGTLPTGLSVDTDYYVVYDGLGTGVFSVSSSMRGTAIETTGAGSGTHSFIKLNRGLQPLSENNK